MPMSVYVSVYVCACVCVHTTGDTVLLWLGWLGLISGLYSMNVLIKAHTYVHMCVLIHHSQHCLVVVGMAGADLRLAQHERAHKGSYICVRVRACAPQPTLSCCGWDGWG